MSLQRVNFRGDVSKHPSLSLSFIKNTPGISLDAVIMNPNFTWHWVTELPDKNWNFSLLSESPHFSWHWIEQFPLKKWNWSFLSTIVTDVKQIIKFPDGKWDWDLLTFNKNISLEQMMETSNLPWKIADLVFDYIDDDVLEFIRHFRFHYTYKQWIDFTKYCPWKIIKQNLDLPWRIDAIKPIDFTEDDMSTVYKYKDAWDWNVMSEYIHFQIIKKYKDLPWIDEYVSRNKSVTYEDTLQTKWIIWNYQYISLEDEKKRWVASRTIQRAWLKHKSHKLGQ